MTEDPDRIERELVLRVPVERVWAAITVPDEMVQWFGDTAEIDLRPGGAGRQTFGDEKTPMIVATVEPTRRFAYYWEPGPGHREDRVPAENRTLVQFHLHPVEEGTWLRLIESGFAALADRGVREGNVEGWDYHLGELTTYLHGE